MLEKLNSVNEPEKTTGDEVKIDPELIKELKKRHPEWFAGTDAWSLRVRLEMAQKMYEETGFIVWV